MGFDFNPTAVARKVNVQWMYQALRNLHQRLPQVTLVNVEDHNKIWDVICFDFATSLLVVVTARRQTYATGKSCSQP
jgi:hypothetical protein